MTPDELMIMTRLCVAMERSASALEAIATRIEHDAKTFDEMVQDGRSLAVIAEVPSGRKTR